MRTLKLPSGKILNYSDYFKPRNSDIAILQLEDRTSAFIIFNKLHLYIEFGVSNIELVYFDTRLYQEIYALPHY